MPDFKRLKKLPQLDMNPMVDMAFLLVSFFMMTTTFKTDTPTEVSIPISHADLKLPDMDVCLITIGKEGDLFFGIDNKYDRVKMLDVMAMQNELSFTEKEKEEFSLISSFGLPMSGLSQFLDLDKTDRKSIEQTGIPLDSANNEFRQWVIAARMANPRLRFAIKADKDVSYNTIHDCFETLRDLNITRFNLITDAEVDDSKP